MSKKLKKKKWFAWILILGAVLITWVCFHLISGLVGLWDWPLNDIRYVMHGKRDQSAFSMLSLISGILGGVSLANYYQRRELVLKLFLVPFLSTIFSILEIRAFQLLGLPLEGSTAIHLGVIVLWVAHIYAYFWFHKNKTKKSRG